MNRRKLPRLAPAPPANPALREWLQQGASDPEGARLDLLRELQTATLLVPILEPAARTGAGRQANLKLAILENSDGQALAGFTDQDAYRRFPPVQHLAGAAVSAVKVCRLARQGNFRAVILNAGGPVSYSLSPLEYQMVADRLLPGEDNIVYMTEQTPAVIGMPAKRPGEDVLQAMRAIVEQAGASEVYWFWMAIAKGAPHLGLAVAPPDAPLIQTIGNALTPLWKEARPETPLLDILPLGTEDHVSLTIREKGERLFPI